MAFPIIQFGTSRFLQAHVDLFVSEALAAGEAIGRIVVVQTTANVASRKRIAAFAEGRPYVVQIKGIAAGPSSTARSRSEALAAASTPTWTGASVEPPVHRGALHGLQHR